MTPPGKLAEMKKKKLLPAYEPARLVRGGARWYIVAYQHGERFRITFNLNRIMDLRMRERRGQELALKVNWWLQQGRERARFAEQEVPGRVTADQAANALGATPVHQAIDFALQVKQATTREDTYKSYRSIAGMLQEFLKVRGWQSMAVQELGKMHASAYMDDCLMRRKVSAVTYNNNIRHLRSLFAELVERDYMQDNPFKHTLYISKHAPKTRRIFEPHEARVVMHRIQLDQPLLFLALLLQYTCFLRPSELRRLRFRDVDLAERLVTLSGERAKTWDARTMTIPLHFAGYFDADFLRRYPPSWYIFGEGFAPHSSQPCGKGTMYRLHKGILEELQREGALGDISGLQWYSWKDTGITEALEQVPILHVQDQAGHHSPEMTLKYRHKKRKNAAIDEWR